MKKLLILFVFLILVLPLMSAVQVELNDNFYQGEPLIAKISGNFLSSLSQNNIYFYRNTYTQVPFQFDFFKIDGDYFLSAKTLGKTSGNYSLVIKNTKYYTTGAQISEEDIVSNFSISENFSDFYVYPGFIVAEGPFQITLQNLKDKEITIYIDKNASSSTSSGEGFFSFLSGNSINSPIQEYVLKAGEAKQVQLEFRDVTNATLRKVKLSTDDFSTEIFVYVDYAFLPSPNESEYIEINDSSTNQTSNQTLENGTNVTSTIPTILKNCSELNGTICKKDEKCTGEQVDSKKDKCCLSSCEKKKKSPAGKIIGWTIFILLIVFYIWFYIKKYKKAKNKVNLLEVAEGKKKPLNPK